MKTLGRILIILTAFALVMGITYVAVSGANAGTSSAASAAPGFERGGGDHQRPSGEHPEFRGEGARGGGWMFGLAKNIGIVGILVALITVPKSLQKRKAATGIVDQS